MAASKTAVDRIVTDRFFRMLSTAKLRPVEGTERSLAEVKAEIIETEARLKKIAHDHYVSGKLSEDVFVSLYDEMTSSLKALRAFESALESERHELSDALPPGDPVALSSWWEAASLEDRREALSKAISKITVHPAKRRGGNQFDTSRVEIEWRWSLYIRAADAEWELMSDAERAESIREQASLNAELDRYEASRA